MLRFDLTTGYTSELAIEFHHWIKIKSYQATDRFSWNIISNGEI